MDQVVERGGRGNFEILMLLTFKAMWFKEKNFAWFHIRAMQAQNFIKIPVGGLHMIWLIWHLMTQRQSVHFKRFSDESYENDTRETAHHLKLEFYYTKVI